MDDAGRPSLALQIRTRTEVSGAEANAAATGILGRHSSELDLSAVVVTVTGQLPSD